MSEGACLRRIHGFADVPYLACRVGDCGSDILLMHVKPDYLLNLFMACPFNAALSCAV
jgi:hypothetical protein